MLAASSMEKAPSSSSSSQIQLPPGFRFHPSDEELIVHYLKNKVNSNPLPASIIAEIDLYKYNPWELPDKALFGEDEWYFFSPRERKYPNGARPNRATGSGYWKATGTDKPILTSCGTKSIGVKKALVFYKGRPPKGTKTDWIMHEYRLLETMIWTPRRKGSMRLDDWVLCRVREKGSIQRNNEEDRINLTGHEPDSYNLPKLNELWPSNENQSIDMAKSYLFNDFPLLPYVFTSQGPFFYATSSITPIQEANHSDHKKNLQISFTETLFNPLKRKSMEDGNQVTSFVIPIKKLEKEDREKEEVISVSNDCSDMNLYGTDHSEGNNFSPDQWNSLMQYQELNLLDFTETD